MQKNTTQMSSETGISAKLNIRTLAAYKQA